MYKFFEGVLNSKDDTPKEEVSRLKIRVSGIVQGVGFRPFVYTLAHELNVSGLVGNDSGGVFIEVEGTAEAIDRFLGDLRSQAPPLAYIEDISFETTPVRGDGDFVIVQSEKQEQANTLLSPDVSVCDDCLAETMDPGDRRNRYPFTNCTNCGPRFTIIQDIPYDRPLTTMASFVMCANCQAEYDDPTNRRFHAQPNACPVCGPHVWLEPGINKLDSAEFGEDPIRDTQSLLAAGAIVAIKGLGGFHLACDATSDAALARLRERKGRVEKPFAVMAADIETVHLFAELSDSEVTILTSKERPIVLLKKKDNETLSELIASFLKFRSWL
jgi:hydrogenase maturation protein HypF